MSQLQEQSVQSEYFESYQRLQTNLHQRIAISSPCKLVSFQAEAPGVFPPGTVTIIVSKKGSSLLHQLRMAVENNDKDQLQNIADGLIGEMGKRKPVSLKESAKLVEDSAVYCNITFQGKTLGSYISLVNNATAAVIVVPYIGGQLRQNDFKVIEYNKQFDSHNYETLLVVSLPAMNNDVKQLTDTVHSNKLGELVFTEAFCPGATGVAVLVLVATAVATAAAVTTTIIVKKNADFDALNSVSISREKMKELGTYGSANMLLGMRRDLLLNIKR